MIVIAFVSFGVFCELPCTILYNVFSKYYYLMCFSGSYWVVTERQQIVNVSSFKEGLEIVFALYYVLNLEYPKPAANSFESMQRYFLKIHPDQGTKNKKGSLSKSKIIGLLTKLRDF